jgi:hypothetical protein
MQNPLSKISLDPHNLLKNKAKSLFLWVFIPKTLNCML